MAVVAGFTAMWLVANELEDPFGADANDIDVLHYHVKFCDSLKFLLERGWLEEDHWVVPSGDWLDPLVNWTNTLKEAKAQKWRFATEVATGGSVSSAGPTASAGDDDSDREEDRQSGSTALKERPPSQKRRLSMQKRRPRPSQQLQQQRGDSTPTPYAA